MYTGGILTVLLFPLWSELISGLFALLIGIILIAPAGIDGTTQMFGKRESNNRLRVVTGLSLGIGIPMICWWGVSTLVV